MIPRCFVDPAEWRQPLVRLGVDESHHVADVLRAGVGDRVVVCDGAGGEALAELVSIGREGLAARVLDRSRQPEAAVMVTLIQAVPKAQKMDWIIQKATEIGVWCIVPVQTDRGVVKLEEDRAGQRAARWQRIAVEAAKQCRTAWIPKVHPPRPLAGALAGGAGVEVLLLGSLEADAVPLAACLAEVKRQRPRSVGLLIGPEGDFSPREVQAARAAGARPVSYGARVLRVETAALYGLCALAYEFGQG
jgi:16S rRNA (uracil1498-N3)-methyltransferase